MVDANIAGAHPLRNSGGDDVSRLAEIFHLLFKHYTRYKSPMIADVFYALRTVVGLGFTICLLDEVYSAGYQTHLGCFLKYDRGNFQKYPDTSSISANHIASMVFLASKSFHTHHCSGYHQEFINNLKDLLNNVIVTEAGKGKEARQILGILQAK